MVQVQKQSQKVIVNINEKKTSKRRKRVRRKREGKRTGVDTVAPLQFIPPIMITPFGEVHKSQPNPLLNEPIRDASFIREVRKDYYQPVEKIPETEVLKTPEKSPQSEEYGSSALMRDYSQDKVQAGSSAFTYGSPQTPEIFPSEISFTNENPLVAGTGRGASRQQLGEDTPKEVAKKKGRKKADFNLKEKVKILKQQSGLTEATLRKLHRDEKSKFDELFEKHKNTW